MNILDPCVKIGGWSESEQTKIFELMKEHFTSWSGISKCLNGRTENSIKNYFYSTIRRIQSLEIFDYFMLMREGKKLPAVESLDSFEKVYQLSKLNLLGKIICKWLYQHEDAKKEHEALFNYLLKMVADEKKRPATKSVKDLNSIESNSKHQSREDAFGRNKQLEILDASALSGVHPLLPAILLGGFKGLPMGMFHSLLPSNFKQQRTSESAFSGKQIEKYDLKRYGLGDLSIPIPQTRDRHESCDKSIPGMGVGNLSPQTVLNQLISSLTKNITSANRSSHVENSHKKLESNEENFKTASMTIQNESNLDLEIKDNSCTNRFESRIMRSSFSPVTIPGVSLSQGDRSFTQYFKRVTSTLDDTDKAYTTQVLGDDKSNAINLMICCKCMMAKLQCNCHT